MCGDNSDCGCGCHDEKVDTGRRRLLKGMGAASLAGVTIAGGSGLMMPRTAHASMAKLFSTIPRGLGDCFEAETKGVCLGPFGIPYAMKVHHYLPVAIVEVVNSAWDSVVFGEHSAGLKKSRRSSVTGGARQGQTFYAHVWNISDELRPAMTFGMSACGWCTDSDAADKPSLSDIQSTSEKVASVAGCGLGANTIKSSMGQVLSQMPGNSAVPLPLVYASEVDKENWQHGCRDAISALVRAPLVPSMCGTTISNQNKQHLTDAKQFITDKLPGLPGMPDMSGLTDKLPMLSRDQVCIGGMGPLYPRQQKVMGTTDPKGALVTAWRALHLAHYDLGLFGKKVTQDGKIQPLYPNPGSKCLRLDDSGHSIEQKIGTSKDGRYAFIYYAPVTCCIDFAQFGCTLATKAFGASS